MTQEELDALPEDGALCFRIEERDGEKYRVPYYEPTVGALWTEADEPCRVVDAQGVVWRVGWAQGKRWKQRVGESRL